MRMRLGEEAVSRLRQIVKQREKTIYTYNTDAIVVNINPFIVRIGICRFLSASWALCLGNINV